MSEWERTRTDDGHQSVYPGRGETSCVGGREIVCDNGVVFYDGTGGLISRRRDGTGRWERLYRLDRTIQFQGEIISRRDGTGKYNRADFDSWTGR